MIRELASYTDQEKCERFDAIYAACRELIDDWSECGRDHGDFENWVFEIALAKSLGYDDESFLQYFNSLPEF